MKTLLGIPIDMLIKHIKQIEGPNRAQRCRCGHRACRHWHVSPQAIVQGVSFDEEEARTVAGLLNLMGLDPEEK